MNNEHPFRASGPHVLVFVGEAPGRRRGPTLGGTSGRRLSRLAGVEDVRRVALVANLLPHWPGSQGKGSAFPLDEGRRQASTLLRRLRWLGRPCTLVLLGKRVAASFAATAGYLERCRVGPFDAYVLPHPSGVNRWWNDPVNVRRAKRFLRRLIQPKNVNLPPKGLASRSQRSTPEALSEPQAMIRKATMPHQRAKESKLPERPDQRARSLKWNPKTYKRATVPESHPKTYKRAVPGHRYPNKPSGPHAPSYPIRASEPPGMKRVHGNGRASRISIEPHAGRTSEPWKRKEVGGP